MLKGIDYINSPEKRAVDLAIAVTLLPFEKAGELIVGRMIEAATGVPVAPVFEQERIGQGHEPFVISKYQTLDPVTEEPYARWARLLRKTGLDEIAQAKNVLDGEMSVFGYRPLIPEEFEEASDAITNSRLKARWHRVIEVAKPGIVSSYGIEHHIRPNPGPTEADIRAEMDIEDVMEASLRYDARLVTRLAGVALRRRLR